MEQALALKKDNFDIESELGPVYDSLGRYEQAAAVIESALQQRPREYELTVQLAKCYVHMGRLDRAKEAFGRAKKIDPKVSQAYIDQGYTYLNAGEFDAARQEFESLITVDTTSPLGNIHMGSYLVRRGNSKEAESYFLRAVQRLEAQPRRDPYDMWHALMWLASTRINQRKFPEAEAALRQSLTLAGAAPQWHIKTWLLFGNLAAAQGRMAEATRYFQRALALCTLDSGYSREQWAPTASQVAVCYANHNRRPEALALARRVRDALRDAKVNSDNVELVGELANLFWKLGDAASAEALRRRIVAARDAVPNHRCLGQALADLAEVRLAQGRLAEARELYLQAIATRGLAAFPEEKALTLDGLAEVYDKEGKPNEARATRQRAGELRGQSGGP